MDDLCPMLFVNALGIGPFVLTLTLIGPANVARIPFVGPILVRFFLSEWDVRNPCARRSKRFSVELGHSNSCTRRSKRFSVELQHRESRAGTAEVYAETLEAI